MTMTNVYELPRGGRSSGSTGAPARPRRTSHPSLRIQRNVTAELHEALDDFNARRFSPALEAIDDLDQELVFRRLERAFVSQERADVAERAARAPREVGAFMAWFERLGIDGPGQGDPLFPWIASEASLAEMRWFLRQEMACEAHGQGQRLCGPAPVRHPGGPAAATTPVRWECLAVANLMTALAENRGFAYQSLGALAVMELTAPGRAAMVDAGLERLGVEGEVRRYFALQATVGMKHSPAWNHEAIAPLIAEDPRRAALIAEGALMRLRAGERCYARYRAVFGK